MIRTPPPGTVMVAATGEGRLTQAVMIGRHVLRADEPVDAGGDDLGPSPHEFILAALGSCTAMTVKMVAERKGWPLTHVEVLLRRGVLPAENGGPGTLILRDIVLEGPLDEGQRRKLLEVAEKCPVHKTLTGEIRIVSGLVGRGSVVNGGEE
ncbi:MAG TPA: OsmC family protein [Magnetospirillum sp.]|nr:OsmC family protein [Magnetospirillum sp.]